MIDNKERAKRFREAREVYNVHGKQTAKTVSQETKGIYGVSIASSMISDLESSAGKVRNVGYTTIVTLADYYGVNVAWLMGQPHSSPKLDEDMQIATKTTKLSSEAIEALCHMNEDYISCLNALLTSYDFQRSLLELSQAKKISDSTDEDDEQADIIEKSNLFRIEHQHDENTRYKVSQPNTISDRQLIKMYRNEALQDMGNAFRQIAPSEESEKGDK